MHAMGVRKLITRDDRENNFNIIDLEELYKKEIELKQNDRLKNSLVY